MSTSHYNELWLITEKNLEKITDLDYLVQSEKSPKSRDAALNAILPIYLEYRNLVKRLIKCYDQIIQPQKRQLIKQVLDSAIGRMLEYNHEIVELESSDYQWPDNFLIQMKMTPYDIMIPLPLSFVEDRKDLLKERRKYIENLMTKNTESPVSTLEIDQNLANSEIINEPDTFGTIAELDSGSSKIVQNRKEGNENAKKAFKEAILMIQAHERARKARCIGALAERFYNYNKKLASGELQAKKFDRRVKDAAATILQKYWRGYAVRKSLKRRINRIEELLGMTIPSRRDESMLKRDKDNCQRRRTLQAKAFSLMKETVDKQRAKILEIRGPGLIDDITEEIREWFLVWYNELGYMDAYPASENGGTILVATGQTLSPSEYLADKLQKEAEKKQSQNKKKKEESTPKSAEKNDDETKKKVKSTGKESYDETSRMISKEDETTTAALEGLMLARKNFVRDWSLRDESKNPEEREYLDLINDKLYYELQLEIRRVVDQLMRLELVKLNEAILKDHVNDEEKFIIPTMTKGKKKKKGTGKKKGKGKDPLGNLSIEDMLNELIEAKIVRNYPEESLDNWQGDLSYENYEERTKIRPHRHRLGEIRDSVLNYCILPLASREIHSVAPLIRSVCICGLPGYGKSFLANAICTAVGAMLFDLTPSNLVGLYEGKKNLDRLMNMIGKLARFYAPSIIFIDGGDKPWWKNIPIADRYAKPKRFAKVIPKFVKTIKPGDQILFLSLATEPFKTTKEFIKLNDKFIMIPVTDYNTIYMFYKDILMKYHGIDRNFNVSSIAKMSVGYPLEIIRKVVERVMNVRRRITLKFRPLDPQEIWKELLIHDGPSMKILQEYSKFESRIPMQNRREKMEADMREELLGGDFKKTDETKRGK